MPISREVTANRPSFAFMIDQLLSSSALTSAAGLAAAAQPGAQTPLFAQPLFWAAFAAIAAAGGIFVYAQKHARRAAALRDRLEQARVKLAAAEARAQTAADLTEQLAQANQERARLEAQNAAAEARLHEREQALASLKERMDVDFRAAASKMLDDANRSFLQRADETFARHRESAKSEADKRRTAMDDLLKPMRDSLVRYEAGLKEMREEQQKARGALGEQIGALAQSNAAVSQEAQKLASALRAGPKVRGRWGEAQLRNVVELAGMSAYTDFEEQAHVVDGDARKHPDMVVSLPGGRKIAVDAKVSINAYLDAVEADNDAARAQHLDRHANDLRNHVKSLAGKDYAAALQQSLDFVVMFVPGENYFAAALEARPDLFQEAFDKKIIIATPTTLVAILKSAAYGWRQEKAEQNAVAVAAMAKDLYDSLRTMGGHLDGLGKSLNSAVKKYNDLLGGVERRVMPRARKFAEYELPGLDAELKTPDPIESAPQLPRPDRDLLLPLDDQSDQSAA